MLLRAASMVPSLPGFMKTEFRVHVAVRVEFVAPDLLPPMVVRSQDLTAAPELNTAPMPSWLDAIASTRGMWYLRAAWLCP